MAITSVWLPAPRGPVVLRAADKISYARILICCSRVDSSNRSLSSNAVPDRVGSVLPIVFAFDPMSFPFKKWTSGPRSRLINKSLEHPLGRRPDRVVWALQVGAESI